MVTLEHLGGLAGKLHRPSPSALSALREEVLGEETDVLESLAQRRDVDADDVEPVKEILAEGAVLDLLLEPLVRRGEDADVGLEGLVSADPRELAALEDAEELALDLKRHVADLVEEEGAAVALLEAADALRHRPGEGALLVAEELALEEVARNRGAVDRDILRLGAARELVDRVRDDLLAHPALAGDEDGGVGAGNAADELVDILHRGGTADDEVVGRLRRDDRVGLGAVLGHPHLLGRGEGAFGDGAELEVHRLAAEARRRRRGASPR